MGRSHHLTAGFCHPASSQSQDSLTAHFGRMSIVATFVLVPGFWLGSWAWRAVTNALRAQQHEVYPLTLTGLADKKHLVDAQIDLDTHTNDVFNLIEYEGLSEVILVGHSYAGLVITAVADRLAPKVAKLVYVDTAPLPNGMALIEFYPPDLRKTYRQRVAMEGGGSRLPFPPWEELDKGGTAKDLDADMRAMIQARVTDMPFGAAKQPVHLTAGSARAGLPKTAIWCTTRAQQVRQLVDSGNAVFQELAGDSWTFIDLPTGHWPMFSKPKELADLLLAQAM
jgi:pimeloyl-ACP methyl ester carboxylesterase